MLIFNLFIVTFTIINNIVVNNFLSSLKSHQDIPGSLKTLFAS